MKKLIKKVIKETKQRLLYCENFISNGELKKSKIQCLKS